MVSTAACLFCTAFCDVHRFLLVFFFFWILTEDFLVRSVVFCWMCVFNLVCRFSFDLSTILGNFSRLVPLWGFWILPIDMLGFLRGTHRTFTFLLEKNIYFTFIYNSSMRLFLQNSRSLEIKFLLLSLTSFSTTDGIGKYLQTAFQSIHTSYGDLSGLQGFCCLLMLSFVYFISFHFSFWNSLLFYRLRRIRLNGLKRINSQLYGEKLMSEMLNVCSI